MARNKFTPVAGGIDSGVSADVDGNPIVNGSGGGTGTGDTVIDPGSLAGPGNSIEGSGDGKQRKKRGPNKSKNTQNRSLDLGTVQNSLIIAHYGLAAAFNAPELALTQDQADAYARAASDVMSHYDMGATAKTIAWVNLVTAMGGIYWGKLSAIAARKASEKAQKVRSNGAANPLDSLIPRASMGMV